MAYQPLQPVPVISDEALSAIYESFARQAIRCLEVEGSAAPAVLLLSIKEGETQPCNGMQLDDESMRMMMQSHESRAVFANMIRAAIDATTPIHMDISRQIDSPVNLVVMISETWVVTGGEDVVRKAVADGVSPSEHPDRGEAIMIQMHTAAGVKTGICNIVRDKDGKPSSVFAPLNLAQMADGNMVAGSRTNRETMEGLIKDVVQVMSEAADPALDPTDNEIKRSVKRPGPRMH